MVGLLVKNLKQAYVMENHTYACFNLWHRIVTTSTPRVTTRKASYGEPQTFQRAIFAECFKRILRTSGSESARWRSQGRDAILVKLDQHDKRPRQSPFTNATRFAPKFAAQHRILFYRSESP